MPALPVCFDQVRRSSAGLVTEAVEVKTETLKVMAKTVMLSVEQMLVIGDSLQPQGILVIADYLGKPSSMAGTLKVIAKMAMQVRTSKVQMEMPVRMSKVQMEMPMKTSGTWKAMLVMEHISLALRMQELEWG